MINIGFDKSLDLVIIYLFQYTKTSNIKWLG
jgi:hypothetical protein